MQIAHPVVLVTGARRGIGPARALEAGVLDILADAATGQVKQSFRAASAASLALQ